MELQLIAGPCSAESREQVLLVAQKLASDGRTKFFRAGVWKPRTRPGAFEGWGATALNWLSEAADATGLEAMVEIAHPTHISEVIKAGITHVWLGARTVANPFSMQEMAETLAGTGLKVWVKNPVVPDVQLWIGGIERLQKLGVHVAGAIHRGFSVYSKGEYRNAPEWTLLVEFRRLMPGLPVFCDPSHISGRRDLIETICQKALDLGLEGLMIEVHPIPEAALSDREQQLTPDAFSELLDRLVTHQPNSEAISYQLQIEDLRRQLDGIDQRILEAFAERNRMVYAIGEIKRDHNVALLQIERWNAVIENLMVRGSDLGLDEKDVKRLFDLIHDASLRVQELTLRESGQNA